MQKYPAIPYKRRVASNFRLQEKNGRTPTGIAAGVTEMLTLEAEQSWRKQEKQQVRHSA